MTTIKTTIRSGRIELRAPDGLREGTEVLVDVTPVPPEKIGIAESESARRSASYGRLGCMAQDDRTNRMDLGRAASQ